MRRLAAVLGGCFAFVAVLAGPAFAHVELEPDAAGPGLNIALTLNVEDEKDDALISQVELFTPENVEVPIIEAATPADPSIEVTTGDTSIVWAGNTVDGDLAFAFTIGPVPDSAQRLQFKVLVTYSNGDIDRWIEEQPAGAEEPEMPGPVLDVVEGGPGTVPDTTVAPVTTVAPESTTVAPETTTATTVAAEEEEDDHDSGPNLALILGFAAIVAVLGGVGYWFSIRNRS